MQRQLPPHSSSHIGGFTLLEVMIALAITAVAVLALSKTMIGSTRLAGAQRISIEAHWVASNELAKTRFEYAGEKKLPRNRSDQVDVGGNTWKYRLSVKEHEDEGRKWVTIEVFTDAETQAPAARLTSLF